MKIRVGFGFDVHHWWQGANFGWAASAWNMKRDCWGTRMRTCSSILSVTHCWERRICVTSAIIFLDTAGEFKNIDSKILLKKTIELIATKGYSVGNIDATICAERPKLKTYIPEMQRTLAAVMGIDEDAISIKATTTGETRLTGREEGISAYATVLIVKE